VPFGSLHLTDGVFRESTKGRRHASASMPVRSMVSHSVACLTAPFAGNAGCQSTSIPTTILFINSTNGKPICRFWR